MTGYAVARLDEIAVMDDGRVPFRPVRHHFGIEAFGVNTWTADEVGDRIVNEHDEVSADAGDGQEELYFVFSGRARFELDGENVDALAGTLVFVRPGVKRTAFAEESPTTVVTIGGTVGRAYEVFGWEVWFMELRRLYDAGDYEAVAARGRDVLETHPYPGLAYNVACAESLAGDKENAIEHLRIAVRSDVLRELAATDSDLDPIRDEPGFEELFAT
jgi:mannose-6-phosphate isomerase-like protein (cupin superfamily)